MVMPVPGACLGGIWRARMPVPVIGLNKVSRTKFSMSTRGVVMLPEKQNKAYAEFYESTAKNDILDPKTTVMIQMAAAMAIGCYP